MLPHIGIYLHGKPAWPSRPWATSCEQALEQMLPVLLATPRGPQHVLSTLREIEISLVDDQAIARVHGDFLNDPIATDVITFPYGEIIVSYETAARYATQHSIPEPEELVRYIVHGLTHLHGYLDASPAQRAALFAVQEAMMGHLICSTTEVRLNR